LSQVAVVAVVWSLVDFATLVAVVQEVSAQEHNH
jgi:hypothetical protein